MKKVCQAVLLIFCFSFLNGCAPTSTATANYIESQEVPQMQPDDKNGIVYFFRPKSSGAFGVWYFIKEGEKELGLMKNNTYIVHKIPTGRHTFYAKTEFKSSVDVDILPNSTNYIECNIVPGIFLANPRIKIVDKARFEEKIKEMTYLKQSIKTQEDSK